MKQKNMFMTAAIISILLFSACNQLEEPKTPKELVKKISTRAGELTLKYENTQATLSGELFRGTPCVSWKVGTAVTKDLPISQVNINIYDENKNKGMFCIQVVAEPQQINEVIKNVDKNTKYIISFEDEAVFEGKLGDRK